MYTREQIEQALEKIYNSSRDPEERYIKIWTTFEGYQAFLKVFKDEIDKGIPQLFKSERMQGDHLDP